MEQAYWLHVLDLVVIIPILIIVTKISFESRLLSVVFFSAALISYAFGAITEVFNFEKKEVFVEWASIVSITFVMCGLFVRIRNSKPIFARFPIYLTFLPLAGLIFYPFIVDSEVVKELLMLVYLAGALAVSILIVSINQFLHKDRIFLLSACISFSFSLSIKLFLDLELFSLLSHLFFLMGIILASLGFKKINNIESS